MKKSLKLFIFLALLCLIAYAAYDLMKNDFSLEQFITDVWNDHVEAWGYTILFCWGILEGELGLIFVGLAAHDGKVSVALAIFVVGFGGFVGDQIYFYIGRYDKNYIQKELHPQRRKSAVAHLLLQKFGWPIIFIQRYMYGFCTIIPMSIGITRYSAKEFALIDLISAWVWAATTTLLAWHFGDLIQSFLKRTKDHWYPAALLIVSFLSLLPFGLKQTEKTILKEKGRKK